MRALVVLLFALALVAPATASERHPSLGELERELICPTCHTTLDQSDAPIARRMKAVVKERIAAGATKSEIKRQLVSEFGPAVLASPPKHGFDLLAWVLPLAGIAAGAAVLGFLAWRWTRAREPASEVPPGALNGRPLAPDVERRVDEELARFE